MHQRDYLKVFHARFSNNVCFLSQVQEIKANLTLNATSLSASIRTKISAPDNRTSAMVAGYAGVAFLVAAFSVPFILDMDRVIRALASAAQRLTRRVTSGVGKTQEVRTLNLKETC
jgi:hypothetical protein